MIEFRKYDRKSNLEVAKINVQNALDKGFEDREIRNELEQMELRLEEIKSEIGDSNAD